MLTKHAITGKDSKWLILFMPLGLPHLEDAIDEALDKGDGDIMLDAVVHYRSWWFILGQIELNVKGTVVKTRGGSQ